MKTLVIHPEDPTTKVLEGSYVGKGYTVITDYLLPKNKLKKAIKEHDRIIMLGHGTKYGLMAETGMRSYRMVVDSTLLYLLREKILIGVWCNADEFFEKYKLEGFYTGMIISEEKEAEFENVEATIEEIRESNNLLTEALEKSINSEDILTSMVKNYVGDTDVINFNKVRLFKK